MPELADEFGISFKKPGMENLFPRAVWRVTDLLRKAVAQDEGCADVYPVKVEEGRVFLILETEAAKKCTGSKG